MSGIGVRYGLCIKHGHEERNRRLAERDPAPGPEPRAITRGLLTEPLVRPLSAIVGAPVTPTPIAPSACTAKEPAMSRPPATLQLRPDPGSDTTLCRIAGCATKSDARGLCKTHYSAARKAGRLEELAAVAKNAGNRQGPKPGPDSAKVLRLERDQAREEVKRLRLEHARHEADRLELERRASELEAMTAGLKSGAAEMDQAIATTKPVLAWVEDLQVRTESADFAALRETVDAMLADAAEHQATLDALVTTRTECGALRAECGVLREARDQLRHELEQIADCLECEASADAIIERYEAQVRSLTERADLFAALGFEADADIGQVIARAKELRATESERVLAARNSAETARNHANWLRSELTRVAEELGCGAHGDAMVAAVRELRAPSIASAKLAPATARHRVRQGGGRDRGELDGYVDNNGLFRATTGAVYGCLYSVEPVATPAPLPEPVHGVGVWVLTTVAEATADSVYLWNGGRLSRSAWTAENVRAADTRPTTFAASSAGDEDIPF